MASTAKPGTLTTGELVRWCFPRLKEPLFSISTKAGASDAFRRSHKHAGQKALAASNDDAAIRAYGARILSLLEAPWPLAERSGNKLAPCALTITDDAAPRGERSTIT
jgi:hypothetical protein